MERPSKSVAGRVVLLLAEGFGAGRVPFAPGTLGTLVGFGWIYLLLLPGNLWIYIFGTILGFGGAIWLGGQAEQLLGRKDPGSIVIDEIAAVPLAFLPAVITSQTRGMLLSFPDYFQAGWWILPVLAFVFFRFFDIAKPFGIARVQKLRGGFGLVLDDLLAALSAALLLFLYIKIAG